MIKKYIEFIREFVESEDIISAKMQELKDLVEDSSEGQNLIYEWENKNDHELVVDFTIGDTSVKYEFDIDELVLTKTSDNEIEFSDSVSHVEDGLDMIEKDIHYMLGISESKANEGILDNFRKVRMCDMILCKRDYFEFKNGNRYKVIGINNDVAYVAVNVSKYFKFSTIKLANYQKKCTLPTDINNNLYLWSI